ncbi:hypothetical protein FBU31_004319 [Coemansia sp. 'formosensis']|nr:hypothetical protein FBU31_004319 [Coemansia sp. 'formosensis']
MPLPTTNTDTPVSPSTTRSKHTVVAVVTVVVDGSVSLSSETTVIDDGNVGNGNSQSDIRADSSGKPYTSTLFENGSAIVITGNLDEPHNESSSALRLVAGLSTKVSAVALVLVAFF